MESSPLTIEPDSDNKKSSKKKRAEAIGSIVVEPASPAGRPSVAEQAHHENRWHHFAKHVEEKDSEADDDDSAEDASQRGEAAEGVPLDEMSDDEKEFAIHTIATNRLEVIIGEISPDAVDNGESQESSDIAAEAVMLEAFYNKLLDDESTEQALAETMQEAGVVPEAAASAGEPDSQPHEFELGLPQIFRRKGESNENETADTPPLSAGIPETTTTASAPPEASHDGAGIPPPNLPPQGLAPEENHPDRGPEPEDHLLSRAAAPNAQPRRTAESDEPRYTRANVVGAALVGGIVGYFVGRRRGRIRTEKKLLPVQKKLEKQVEALGNDIFNKEVKLRKAAREQSYQQHQINKMKEAAALKPRGEIRQPQAIAEAPRQERVRTPALEANQLHGKKHPAEKIGHVLMTAEDRPSYAAHRPPTESKPVLKSNQRIETMDRQDLLDLSDKVAVNDTTLRRVYENHLVGERGLRRMVETYMHGGNVEKVLREEMLEREIDFERDPVLRDRPKRGSGEPSGSTLKKMLEKVDTSTSSDQEARAILEARQAYQDAEIKKAQNRRRVVDTTLTGTILVLLAVILLLAITR
jgi:hypothetical protein